MFALAITLLIMISDQPLDLEKSLGKLAPFKHRIKEHKLFKPQIEKQKLSLNRTKTQPTNFPINTQKFGKRKLDFSSIKPRINTNNPRKRISKEETERMLEEWRIKRGKGQEQWKLRHKKKRVVSSKYTKKKVHNFGLFCFGKCGSICEGIFNLVSSNVFSIFHYRLKS